MNRKPRKASQVFFSTALLLTLLCPPALVFGQEARGSISGTVRDVNQAVIADAPVKVNNLARGTSISMATNEAGYFRAPYLVPGTYQLVVEARGFKKYVRDGVELRIGETLDVNISLETGGAEESVNVTATGLPLETATASLGQAVDSRRVAELPLVHGDPYTLIALSPGASFARDPRLDRPFEPTHIVGYTVDGTRANRSDLTIDGVPSTATANAFEVIASYVPPTDAIQEFKVQTATFDAQFGNTEGGVTSIGIKSGTNSFHGSAYFWEEPAGITANDFFGNATKQGRPDSFSNRWGGSLGGPVWIPKVYNGRNKTFFFWAYEGIRDARPRNNGTPTTASAAMLKGDFSELLKLGPAYQIYNPFTRKAVAGGRFQQDPFPNNIIPSNLIDPVAKALVENYWPQPTSAGAADGTNNFLQPNLKERAKYSTNTIRVDQSIGDKHRLFGRASWYDRESDYNNYFHNLATGEFFYFRSRQGAIDEVWSINPTTVLNLRYGYNRFIRATVANPENHGFDLTSVGFPASYNNSIPEDKRRFPAIDITGYQGTRQNEEFRPNDLHSAIVTLNKALGAHSLKAGYEFRGYRETDSFAINDVTGRFNFDSTWTRGPLDNSATAPGSLGQSFAAFLLGLPTTTNSYVARLADYAEQSTTSGLYFQDDWKVTPNLTLNLGLRYEYETPLTERYNRSVSGFDNVYIQPVSAQAAAAFAASQGNPATATPEVTNFQVPGGLLFATEDDRGLYNTPKHNFMPRLGFAYQINSKTVVRGGYGLFYGFLGQRRGDVIQSGFSQNTPFIPTQDNGLHFIATLSNPFPNGIQEPVGAAAGKQTFLGQTINYFNQAPLAPRNQRFQFSVQRELPGGFLVEAAYVGNRGSNIEINRNLNVTPQKYLSTSLTRDQAKLNYLTANVPNPLRGLLPASASGTFTGTNIARERLMRPFPAFDQVNSTTYEGESTYNGLQLRLDKRLSRGFTLGVTYTYSKFTQSTELLNQDDQFPTEVISDQDFPHRLSVSGIYELPFGAGHGFLNNKGAVVSKLVSGWQVQGIYAYQSGPPLAFGNATYLGDFKNIKLDKKTVEKWFNNSGFVALRDASKPNSPVVTDPSGQPVWVDFNDPCKTNPSCAKVLTNPTGFNRDASFQLDHNIRTFPLRFDFLRGDAYNNFDLSLVKNTSITETTKLQLRFEATNAFNHPQFPTGSLNTTQFGGPPAGGVTTNGVITAPTSATFGQVVQSNQANYPRRIQLGIKFIF
ncbi:MAG TPA: TonB-dependent receptor [Blastocatellia bacterium]|nr:TonB-dependent receptor [Blastocatellia bacterium]